MRNALDARQLKLPARYQRRQAAQIAAIGELRAQQGVQGAAIGDLQAQQGVQDKMNAATNARLAKLEKAMSKKITVDEAQAEAKAKAKARAKAEAKVESLRVQLAIAKEAAQSLSTPDL